MNVGDKAMYIERKGKLLWLKENFLPSSWGSFTGVLMNVCLLLVSPLSTSYLEGSPLREWSLVPGHATQCLLQGWKWRVSHVLTAWALPLLSEKSSLGHWAILVLSSSLTVWFVPALAESWDCKADSNSSSSSWNSLGGKQKDFKEHSLINSTLNTLLVLCVIV